MKYLMKYLRLMETIKIIPLFITMGILQDLLRYLFIFMYVHVYYLYAYCIIITLICNKTSSIETVASVGKR